MDDLSLLAVLGVGGFCAAQLWAINGKLATLCERVQDHSRRLAALETKG